jgi:hypothetical protein
MFHRGGKTAIAIMFTGFLIFLLEINSCGIYTAQMALNPPFNQQKTDIDLTFSGDNEEPYFSGYVLWYKEVDVDYNYVVCVYNGKYNKPTLSFVPPVQTTQTIRLVDLSHQEYGTFDELIDAGGEFKFAVSSYGINGEESAKVEF